MGGGGGLGGRKRRHVHGGGVCGCVGGGVWGVWGGALRTARYAIECISIKGGTGMVSVE